MGATQTTGVDGARARVVDRFLGPDQRALVERVATLAQERFAPRAARYDAEAAFPAENYQDLHEAGLLGLTIPQAYGGLEVDSLTYALCLLEIAKGDSATALTFNMHATVASFIAQLGTEEQKQRVLRAVTEQGKLIASVGSEPESSFRDKFVVHTVVRRVDGGYQFQGVKHFCSLGAAAAYHFTWGVLEGSPSPREGMVTVLIPRDAPGVTFEPVWNALGMRGTASDTFHYDTFIPDANVLGGLGSFFTADLSGWSLGYAATYLGIGEAAYDFLVEHVKTKSYGPAVGPMCNHPLVQRRIGEMATAIRGARLMLCEAALLRDQGDRTAVPLVMNQVKYVGCEVGHLVTDLAIRTVGGTGILKRLPLERWYRDATAGPVMPPADDRCLETTGRIICGLEAATLEFV